MNTNDRDKDVVLDLETYGVKPGAIVLSIGAATLDGTESFYTSIDIQSCRDVGLLADPATVAWWENQDSAAYAAAHSEDVQLKVALAEFYNWYIAATAEDSGIWSNGATFDAPILEAAYKACGMIQPWNFYNERCFRTPRAMFPQVTVPEFEGLKHHALDDAKHEAKHLAAILAYIEGDTRNVS